MSTHYVLGSPETQLNCISTSEPNTRDWRMPYAERVSECPDYGITEASILTRS